MNNDEMLKLMRQFRRAYGAADGDALRAVTTADFEWHQHVGRSSDDQPSGRILVGVGALLEEIAWRSEHWQDVSYEGMVERSAGDILVQTFTIRGIEGGKPFHADAVD